MKIKRLFFILLSGLVLFNACKFLDFDGETGLVLVKLGSSSSNSRSLNSEGLPYIKDTDIKIIAINKSTGNKIERSVAGGSTPSISLPIGESYIIRVKIYNALGIWSGEKEFTVSSGTNEVNVKIKRKASGFRNIGFSMWKSGSSSEYEYALEAPSKRIMESGFYIGSASGKPSRSPLFCRNNKGWLYVAGESDIYLYDSEGFLKGSKNQRLTALACDYVTNEVYAVSDAKLYTVEADLGLSTTELIMGVDAEHLAVYDNLAFTVHTDSSNGLKKLEVYKINGGVAARIKTEADLNNNVIDPLGFAISNKAKVQDCFVDENAVYLLLSDNGDPSSMYTQNTYLNDMVTVSGILKLEYNYNESASSVDIGGISQMFGIQKLNSAPLNGVLNSDYYTNNFYKPVKFIGKDGDILYIADDGVQYEKINGNVLAVENRNRIAAFNTKTNSLSFSNVADSSKWLGDALKLYNSALDTGIIFWVGTAGNYILSSTVLNDYPQPILPTAGGQGTDVFCHDEAGELYWINNMYSTPTNLQNIFVEHYIKDVSTGGYVPQISKDLKSDIGEQNIVAVAVDKASKRYYCAGLNATTSENKIYCFEWSALVHNAVYKPSKGIDFTSTGDEVTALALKGNYLFVALKEINNANNTYSIYVKKYNISGSSPVEVQTLMIREGITLSQSGTPNNNYMYEIDERISDMQILNNKLYAISYKIKNGGWERSKYIYATGKLFMFGNIDSSLTSSEIWSGNDKTRGYAPYRFVARKEDELVVASDGCYATNGDDNPLQKNKLLIFDLNGALKQEEEIDFNFSKEVYAGSSYSWR